MLSFYQHLSNQNRDISINNSRTFTWVRSLQLSSTSKILHNGNLSETIHLRRGCTQGDPIAFYLFVLATEFLAEAIRTNKKIEGLTMSKKRT